MGHSLVDAATLLEKVLEAMDEEIAALQVHLDADAAHLRDAVEASNLSQAERVDLLAATDRIETTAQRVASFGRRHSGNDGDDSF